MNSLIILQILISSVIATSVMTLFSYTVSEAARETYKEPVLLGYILSSLNIKVSSPLKLFLGWLMHYLIGVAFVVAYHIVWYYQLMDISWKASILLGIISGIIGIISWVILFKMVPTKPNIDFKGYYAQLFVAHMIFAIVAYFIYNLFI